MAANVQPAVDKRRWLFGHPFLDGFRHGVRCCQIHIKFTRRRFKIRLISLHQQCQSFFIDCIISDGIQKIGLQTGLTARMRTLISTPFSDYQAAFLQVGWERKAGAGLAGLALVYATCLIVGRVVARRRSA